VSIKEQLTLAAGLAVALATAALFPLFQGNAWFVRVIGAIVVVTLAGLVGRRLGLPRPLQPLLGLGALLAYLVLVFAGSTLTYGLLPGGHTLDVLRHLVDTGRGDIERFGPPIPSTEGLVLLTAAGVGAIALVVDVLAVALDRAALAGLPLLVLFAVPSAVLPGGLGGLPFVLGAIGWLGLLLVEGSERVGRWGTPMRSSLPGAKPGGDDSSLGRVGRRIGFAAVSLAVIVPAVLPGLDHRLVGGNGSDAGNGPGNGEGSSQKTFNPITRLQDQLSQPTPTQLLIYRTTDPQPDYLRMTTLDTYNGSGWSASKLEADRKNARVQKGIATPVGDLAPHRDFTMKIAVDRDHLAVYWLPVPFGPTKVDVDGTWLWDPKSQTVFSASRTTVNLPAYNVTASRVLPDRNALDAARTDGVDPSINAQYGQAITVTPYVRNLVKDLTAAQASEYDKAAALQAYFTNPRNGFVYDLHSSQPTVAGGDALTAFLTGKHGFCEQYATAMAAMLRVAGIPSRVAVGFTPGTRSDDDKTLYSVTTSDAHAWPEAWFPGTGWVRFEPTPSVSGSTVPDYSVPVAAAPNAQKPGGNGPVPTASATPKGRPLGHTDPDLLDKPLGKAAPTATGTLKSGPSLLLLAPIVLGVLLVLPFLLTVVRRRRRWMHPDALTAWNQLRDDATDVGHVWRAADSPRTAAARLREGRALPASALEALQRITVATERSRYAPPSQQVAATLRAEVGIVRAALQNQASLSVRLRARLLPASTLQWASTALGEASGNLMGGLDDGIAALTRPLRRRTVPR
jgi:transglutaminase-like putative cysteine protease